MRVGVPKEIKNHEYRVGLTPESVSAFTSRGHTVLIETGAGEGIGASDEAYRSAGAVMLSTPAQVFEQAEMIVKVKEPLSVERAMLRHDQILFTYLHLAPDVAQTEELINSNAVCIAYETITDDFGGLPLLKPMSQVAGRMSVHAGASALEKSNGGRGVLLGGVPGVEPANVAIIGGGVVGFNAAQMAVGMQANVTIIDRDVNVLERLANHFESKARVLHSNPEILNRLILDVDMIIGAVLIPGASAPNLVSKSQLQNMKKGAVVVDVAIDQGGCFETSRPTTHSDPTFIEDGIVHYCVANMPGGVARTSTYALNNATLGHALSLAELGWRRAMSLDRHLRSGLNICHGHVTCKPVSDSLGIDYVAPESFVD